VERVDGLATRRQWRQAYRDIVDFERTLADEGTLFVKLWLHISKKEQKRRFKSLQADPLTAWHVTDEDWRHHEQYDEYLRAAEDMLAETSTEWAPWTIVEATDRHFARAKIVSTILATVQEGVARARDRREGPVKTSTAPATSPRP
jgi:polyphosphate kinase 2 (PPK2 family)